MKKIILAVLLGIIVVSSFLCADTSEELAYTRDMLATYTEDNTSVLEMYYAIADQWETYHSEHENFPLNDLLAAVQYATIHHNGQYRKDAAHTPYIIHPIGVCRLLWEIGEIRSRNVLTAAILHDTLEDTDATEEEIEQLFGSRVLYTVQELTNDPNLSSDDNKQRQVDHAPHMSLDGQLAKLSDRLYNIQDLKDSPPPSWTQDDIDRYYSWGEKLLHALTGANTALEAELKELLINR